MKKIVIKNSDSVNSLVLVESEIPEPKDGEVLIKVEAAGVAFADIMMRHGKYPGTPKLPFTPGYDIVGRIEKSKGTWKSGDRVMALTQFGGYAQYITVPIERIVKVPEESPAAELVCLPLNYVTAYQMLQVSGALNPGSVILIHSAAGGVGTALLQLARNFGIKAYGTASLEKHDIVRKFGGIPIDYKYENFTEFIKNHEEDVFAVFDSVG